MVPLAACPHCRKNPVLCVCAEVIPVEGKIRVAVLQHPREQDRELGTAAILTKAIPGALLRVALSCPNLTKVVGGKPDPKEWAVLYLGSKSEKLATDSKTSPFILVNRKGVPHPDQDARRRQIKGVLALDGNWPQVKALWWRNPWLLKLQRAVIVPTRQSLYGKLRREPRRESVSTIEAVGLALSDLESNPKIYEDLMVPFKLLLERYRKFK